MAHITAITAAYHSVMSVARTAVPGGTLTSTVLQGLFTGLTTNTYLSFDNVRDFPTLGSTANIVKVPVYGSSRTYSIGAQGDAPDYSVKVNFVPTNWVATGVSFMGAGTGNFGDAVSDNVSKVFQFTMMKQKPTNYNMVAGGIGTVLNTQFYFIGRIESYQVTPARDDAVTADVQLSVQSELLGPFTI
jgi:hypothetical protein